MPRFSANLGLLWADLPLLERVERAARAGFRAVELQFPYDTPAREVGQACRRLGLTLLNINAPPGGPADGASGLAALPGREQAFREAMEQAIAWCRESGARGIHAMAGTVPAERRGEAAEVLVGNLRHAAAEAECHGLTVLVEAINRRDKPDYFYATQAESHGILQRVGAGNLRMLFDVYHVGVSEGDVLTRLERYLPWIGHVQIAAVPSRAEPDEGEIRYEAVFQALDRLGYAGWVGCEYRPRAGVEAGLGWRQALAPGAG